MRIPIRVQLGALLLINVLVGLAVVVIVTWEKDRNALLDTRGSRLSLSASLKAGQITSALVGMQASAGILAGRLSIQAGLKAYYAGIANETLWYLVKEDLVEALSGSPSISLAMQLKIYPNHGSNTSAVPSLINVTGNAASSIALPANYSNGSTVYLGDNSDLGYPMGLYPNITFEANVDSNNASVAIVNGVPRDVNSALLIGPLAVNTSFFLFSVTMPIINNATNDVLGWITVIENGAVITDILQAPDGLDETGALVLIGPGTTDHQFPVPLPYNVSDPVPNWELEQTNLRFVLPIENYEYENGINTASLKKYSGADFRFNMTIYPSVLNVLTLNHNSSYNNAFLLKTQNDLFQPISTGFALIETQLAQWVVVLEQNRREVWSEVNHLRHVLLACVFGTAGGMFLLMFPLAHWCSLPIGRLREATAGSMKPPDYESISDEKDKDEENGVITAHQNGHADSHGASATGRYRRAKAAMKNWRTWFGMPKNGIQSIPPNARLYNIPQKVKDRHHWIQDELTDLTATFNAMSDELALQYERLEERVKERTLELELKSAELEVSKRAAEAANESKTIFLANISHELKTPLNGVLGMCAVCMQEDDPVKIKRSLNIINKSGDLLNCLLTDLLTFSKNQVGTGEQLMLDEKEFYLCDIGMQLEAVFGKQAQEQNITLHVEYLGTHFPPGPIRDPVRKDYGPPGTGRVKDMSLHGDIHRLLQVAINMTSNALKFTPPGGSVWFRIHCFGEDHDEQTADEHVADVASARTSLHSRQSRQSIASSMSRTVGRGFAYANQPNSAKLGTATEISRQRRPSRAPDHEAKLANREARTMQFAFEVQDTGPGVPEHLQDHIFEPFVQGDLRLTKKYGGTGLGLSICSQLARLMHGHITLDSTVGVGSTFTFHVPLRYIETRFDSRASSLVDLTADLAALRPSTPRSAFRASANASGNSPISYVVDISQLTSIDKAPPPAAESDSPSQPEKQTTHDTKHSPRAPLVRVNFASDKAIQPVSSIAQAAEPSRIQAAKTGKKVTVLVVEDNKINQEIVQRMLKLEKIVDVELADDGVQALEKVKERLKTTKEPYDLIFMDIQMPNMDGRESTRLIRELGYSAPIVALTAFADESNEKACMESGMDYFMSKPIRRPALKHVVKTYCSRIEEEKDKEDEPARTKSKKSSLSSASGPSTAFSSYTTIANSTPGESTAVSTPATSYRQSPDVTPMSNISENC